MNALSSCVVSQDIACCSDKLLKRSHSLTTILCPQILTIIKTERQRSYQEYDLIAKERHGLEGLP